MESLFERIANLGMWDSYIRTMQGVGTTDEELSAAMIDATFTHNEELLHRLIVEVASGRRVFKQLCRKGTMPFYVSLHMHTRQEIDLAFNVVVGVGLWTHALELYGHPQVTPTSRRRALLRAIRERSWDDVARMVLNSVTPHHQRRHAFLSAVRQGEMAVAVRMCAQGVSVSDGDIRFALKTSLATDQSQCLPSFLQLFQSDAGKYKGLKCILKHSIHMRDVDLFSDQHISTFSLLMEIVTNVNPGQSGVTLEAPTAVYESATAMHESATSMHGSADVVHVSGSEICPESPTQDGSVIMLDDTTVSSVICVMNSHTQESNLSLSPVESSMVSRQDLLKYALRQAVAGNNVQCFRSLCLQVSDNEGLLRYAFWVAIRVDKFDLIVKTFEDCHNYSQRRRLLQLAVMVCMKHGKSDFVKKMSESHDDCLDWVDFFSFETDYITSSKNWSVVIPIVETRFLESKTLYPSEVFERLKWKIGPRKIKLLTRWCMQNAFRNFALLLAVWAKQWRLAKRIIQALTAPMPLVLFDCAFDASFSARALSVAVACLKQAPKDVELNRYVFMGSIEDVNSLIQLCRSEGLAQWVVKLGVCADNWQVVEAEMETCDDESTLGFVLNEAAERDQWQLVTKLLDRCSGREPCLRSVLTSAVQMGECACARKLLDLIDPLADPNRSDSLLQEAVESGNEEMINLSIEAGVSTHQQLCNPLWSPMRQALSGYFPGTSKTSVIKALFESGACDHAELQFLKNDLLIKRRLGINLHTVVLEYMKTAAGTPRSLQSLCRLTVSHHIGCRPGRESRILSLPVPARIKDFIRFKDILLTPERQEPTSDTDDD